MADPLYDPAVANSGFAGMLDDPRARAALLQFGLQLMQPNYGQSTMGHLGQAIGAGGEAIGRLEEQDRKAADSESKLATREANIYNQQGKLDARAAGEERKYADMERKAGESQQTFELRRQKLEQDADKLKGAQERFGLTQSFRNNREARIAMDAEVDSITKEQTAHDKAVEAYNKRKLIDPSNPPTPSERIQKFRGLGPAQIKQKLLEDPNVVGALIDANPGTGSAPPTAPAIPRPPSSQPIGQGTLEPSGKRSYPIPPRDEKMIDPNTVYDGGPLGPVQWNPQTKKFRRVSEGI